MKPLELSGKRFGMLSVVGFSHKKGAGRYWLCSCDCGESVVRHQVSLVHGHTLSCGCRKRSSNAGHFKATHGLSRTETGRPPRLYKIWDGMKHRTGNPKAHGYERYGGAGITVCEQWINSYEKFAADMGEPPTDRHTLDRIDSSLGYSPENCRWATYTEQNRNRSNVIKVEYEGEELALSELALRFGLPVKAVYMRVTKYGWPIDRALNTPIRK